MEAVMGIILFGGGFFAGACTGIIMLSLCIIQKREHKEDGGNHEFIWGISKSIRKKNPTG